MENLLGVNQKSRLNLSVSAELNDKMNSWAKELHVTLTDLAKNAIGRYIDELERSKREQELAEACKNHRQFHKKFSSEWAKFETRIE